MIICLYPRECNWLISKKTIVINFDYDYVQAFLVRQYPSGAVLRDSRFLTIFDKNFNLISLNSRIKIIFNDINDYLAAKQYTLCETGEHKKSYLGAYLAKGTYWQFFHKLDSRETSLLNAANHFKIFLIEFEICLNEHLYFLYIRNPLFPIVAFISMFWQLKVKMFYQKNSFPIV